MADAESQPPREGGKPPILVYAVAAGVVLVIILAIVKVASPSRPGDPSVYTRIDNATDCGQLRREFNTADANHSRDLARGRADLAEISMSYMEAAQARMGQLGC